MKDMWVLTVFFIALLCIFGIWISIVFWSLKNGISPMPTSRRAGKQVLSFIPKEAQGVIVDLGSGWGSMAILLAKHLPDCHIVGYETSPIPYAVSCILGYLAKAKNLQFLRKDFFQEDLAKASLVYCYLYPKAMIQLKKKFEVELCPGTIVISNTFAISKGNLVQVADLQDIYHTRIYKYEYRL